MAEAHQGEGGAAVSALYAQIMRTMTKKVLKNTGGHHKDVFKDLDFNIRSMDSIVLEMENSEENQETTELLALLKRVNKLIREFALIKKQIAKLGFAHFHELKEVNNELKSFCQNWEYQKAKRALQNEVDQAANRPVEVVLLYLRKIRALILEHTAKAPEDFRSIFESLESALGPIEQMVQQMDRSAVPFLGHRDANLLLGLLKNIIDCFLRFESGQRQDSIKKDLEYHGKRLQNFLPDEVQMERAMQDKELQRNKSFWKVINAALSIAIIGFIIIIVNSPDKNFREPSRSNLGRFGFLSRFFVGKSDEYDIFLSFRGVDTREKFTRFLYDALENENLRTFMDDTTITPGEEIPLRIVEGIKNSLNAVVIFSENFANSSWCLDELLHIYKRKETFAKYKIFPICYYITPEDIYEDGRKYHQELEKHKKQYGHKVAKWKEVLTKFENISATTLEGKMRVTSFIKETVEVIKKATKGLPTQVG